MSKIIVNTAKSSLENLKYKNEQSFSFEKFSAKLQKAYDELEDNGRTVQNGDIIDALWEKIQISELQANLDSLKVDYVRNPAWGYKLILQDVASEIDSNSRVAFDSGTGTRDVAATSTCQCNCPVMLSFLLMMQIGGSMNL